MNRVELVKQVMEIVNEATDNPAEELVKMGNALVAIGEALKGQSPADSRAIIESVRHLV